MKIDKKNYIANIFKINKSTLKNDNIKYFYTKHTPLCCNIKNLKPFLDDIGPYEYDKLAREIGKLYKNTKYNNFILDFVKNILSLKKDNTPLNISANDLYLNYLIIMYVQCRTNIKITTIWPVSKTKNTDLNNYLKDKTIYAVKKIKLSFKAVQNLIYQMYAYTNKYKTIETITEYCKKIGWKGKNDNKFIKIYVYEGPNITIDGSHTTHTFMEAITLSKIYFNKNSVNFLDQQILSKIISYRFRECRILFNTFINYLYNNIELFDINKFLVLSGTVLFSFGIRKCSDIDFFIGDNPSEIKTVDFIKKIDHFFLNEKTKFYFTDAYTKLIPKLYWRNFWEEWHIEWAKLFGAQHISETIFNPKYHYYYMGIKLLHIDADIVRRNVRGRPAAVADLIMISRLLGKNIKINPIPKETLKYDVYTKTDKSKFINTVRNWLKRRYGVDEKKENLEKIIKFE